jgi:hypothetical protein
VLGLTGFEIYVCAGASLVVIEPVRQFGRAVAGIRRVEPLAHERGARLDTGKRLCNMPFRIQFDHPLPRRRRPLPAIIAALEQTHQFVSLGQFRDLGNGSADMVGQGPEADRRRVIGGDYDGCDVDQLARE